MTGPGGRTSFTLLPAVDVADGRTARVVLGGTDREAVDGSPAEAARAWQADGARWVHLVDLDAAFGRGANTELLAAVVGELDIAVELAGGIVDDASLARALASGCARVSLGTAALGDPAFCARAIAEHGERVAISLDVQISRADDDVVRHRLVARGGTVDRGDLWETLERLEGAGCARYIVTDVRRDGQLEGPAVDLYRAVCRVVSAPVIASGGISSIEDLVLLAQVAATGANLEGSIVGQALHAGRFTLPEALAAMRRVDETTGLGH